MMNKIEWIRSRMSVGRFPVFDVYYSSGRIRTYMQDEAPKSVKEFIFWSTQKITQIDKLWGVETIYKAQHRSPIMGLLFLCDIILACHPFSRHNEGRIETKAVSLRMSLSLLLLCLLVHMEKIHSMTVAQFPNIPINRSLLAICHNYAQLC